MRYIVGKFITLLCDMTLGLWSASQAIGGRSARRLRPVEEGGGRPDLLQTATGSGTQGPEATLGH